jgi:Cytochrome P450
MSSLLLLSDKIFHLTNDYKRDKDNRNFIFKSLLDFISTGNVEEPADGFKQNIFLHKLLRIRKTLTDEQMKDHILAIGAAAFDALASSTAYCVLFLAMHVEIQKKVAKEIFEVFSGAEELITLENLAKLRLTICALLGGTVPIFYRLSRVPLTKKFVPNFHKKRR